MRRTFRWVLAVLLAALLGLTAAALLLTGAPAGSASQGGKSAPGQSAQAAIDETPLTTARHLAPLARTPQEQALSQEALRLADHEVDLAFSQALRQAAEQPAPTTPRTLRLEKAVKRAQAQVDADRQADSQLTREAGRARGAKKGAILQRLQLSEAELSLDQDELKDVRKALLTAGGGAEAQLQQLLDQHEKSESHALANAKSKSEDESEAEPEAAAGGERSETTASLTGGNSFFARLSAWAGLLREVHRIASAQSAAAADAAEFGSERDALQQQIQAEQSKMHQTAGEKSVSVASALSSMRRLNQEQANLSAFGQRANVEGVLARVYGQWVAVAQTEARTALHRLIGSVFWILLVLFLAVVSDLLISRLFSRFSFDRKRLHTIHSVLRFATRAIAAVIILIVIFGPPRQLGTIVGLVGAGLAVALKDFIVAFLGWFRLIGPGGMRPGDWVEINGAQQITGVQGKVLEVGLLFTVILESGNWTDAGHPTGRRVAFINSFAIEGYYFNFTTAGQWLWDEIQFGLPAGLDPYPLLDSLRRAAEKETATNAHLAEQDWKRAMTGSGLEPFSAKSSITVRPTEAGMNVVIRYIAHADEREDLRQRLYHAAFEILHGARAPEGLPGGTAPSPETA